MIIINAQDPSHSSKAASNKCKVTAVKNVLRSINPGKWCGKAAVPERLASLAANLWSRWYRVFNKIAPDLKATFSWALGKAVFTLHPFIHRVGQKAFQLQRELHRQMMQDKRRIILQAGRVEMHIWGSSFCIDASNRVCLRTLRVSLIVDTARMGPEKRR